MIIESPMKYIKTDEIKNGETITIKDEGQIVTSAKYTYQDGSPRKDLVIKVLYKNEEKDMRLNATNKNTLVSAYGKDTAKWVGKILKMEVVNVMISGKMSKTIILTPTEITDPSEIAWKD